MYEENHKPLPRGDVMAVFGEVFADMQQHAAIAPARRITPENVVQWADKANQQYFAKICRRLLLPGSEVRGFENLAEFSRLAREGKSCLLCPIHRSNLDVPTLFTLLEDQAELEPFHRIIWIAGRKLSEDAGLTSLAAQCFNRVIVTPRSWFETTRSDAEVHDAHAMNVASERAIHRLRHEGWIFAMFPSGTRIRPGKESTAKAIEETDSYLKHFEYLLLCHIDGCTLPVAKDWDLTHERPKLDRVVYTFGTVESTVEWRNALAKRFPDANQRQASAEAIIRDIEALVPENESPDT